MSHNALNKAHCLEDITNLQTHNYYSKMLNKYTSALVLALLAAEATAVQLGVDEDGFPFAEDCEGEGALLSRECKDYCVEIGLGDPICDPLYEAQDACTAEPLGAECSAYCEI